MNDATLNAFREIAERMMEPAPGEGPRDFSHFGEHFVLSGLTRNEAMDRLQKKGGRITRWDGEQHIDVLPDPDRVSLMLSFSRRGAFHRRTFHAESIAQAVAIATETRDSLGLTMHEWFGADIRNADGSLLHSISYNGTLIGGGAS